MVVLALGGMFYVMSRQENLWLRTLSLVGNASITTLYQSCIFLNLFSYPIRQLMISILLLAGLLCISFIAGLMLHCKHHAIPTAKSPVKKWGLIVGLHTKLSAHEWRKLLLMRGGAVALAILAMVQAITYWDFDTPDDIYYRQYAEVLVGTPSDKKDAYLEAQSAYFAKIHKQIEHYSQLYGDNTEALVMLLTPLERKLVSEPAFDEAKKQYEALSEDGIFLYATGYNRLFQSCGISDDLLNTGKLFVTLIIALSGTFAVEYETGMNVLVVAAGMERRVRYLKLTQGSIFLLLGVVLSYIPQCIAVERNYGLPLISAAACNLTIFSSLPEWFPIWGIFLVVLLVHLGIGILSLSIILFLSQKIQNTVVTVLISAAIFLLPLFLIKIYLL